MLSIDEAIARERQLAKEQRSHIGTLDKEYSKKCEECAKEHKQLAEWLEELKEYRKHIKLTEIPKQYKLGFQDGIVNGFESGYNNAIDDFIRKCEMESRVILDEITHLSYYGLSMRELQRIAEQLKEGEQNDR